MLCSTLKIHSKVIIRTFAAVFSQDSQSEAACHCFFGFDAFCWLGIPNLLTTKLAMNQKAEKTRYNDEELEEFKELIEAKLAKARNELQFYRAEMVEMADNPDVKIKGLDDGINTAENERLNNMAARQRKLVRHLENALIRIENKSYGVCRATGKLIAKERLRAVPHATLSIEAKQNQ
jgi:DnaK suppressor protein